MYLIKRNKIYHLFYRDENGKSKSITTKCSKKSDALRKASEILHKPKVIHVQSADITLKQFKEVYKTYTTTHFTLNYQKLVECAFTQFSRVINESTLIKEVTPVMIESFIHLKTSEGKRAIINGYLKALQGSFQRAVEQGYLIENVFRKVKLLKLPENYPLYLKEGEFGKILAAENDPQMRLIFSLAINTGMRRDEVRLLKWESVDLENKLIQVKNHNTFTTKSKRSRIIPIHYSLLDDLLKMRAQNENSEFLFTRNNSVVNKELITKRFRKAVLTAKLNNGYHFHTLRHTFASKLVQKGVSLYIVSRLLGHVDIKTTEIYSHLRNGDLRNAIDLLNN